MLRYRHLLVTCICLLLAACTQEDDISEIFASGQRWHWSSSYVTEDWDKEGAPTLTFDESATVNAVTNRDAFIVTFSPDGTVKGAGQHFTFNGSWTAEGKDRTMEMRLTPSSTPAGLDKVFFDQLRQARFYRGDARLLKLFDKEKRTYLLLYAQ